MTRKSLHDQIDRVLNDKSDELSLEESQDLSAQITKEKLEPVASPAAARPAETETMRKFSQMISKRRINQI